MSLQLRCAVSPSLTRSLARVRRFAFGLAAVLPVAAVAAPTITLPPSDVTVVSGHNATFTVAANGSGTLSYQWRRDGLAIAGATADTFVVRAARRHDADRYDVVVTDAAGSTPSGVVRLRVAPTSYPAAIASDPTATAVETSVTFGVNALLPLPDGGLICGGNFSALNGTACPGLARVLASGDIDPQFNPPVFDGAVNSVGMLADGRLLVGGAFTWAGGYRRNGLARLNANGSLDVGFDAGLGEGTVIHQLAVLATGKILIAGTLSPSGVLRLNADGSRDASFASSITGNVTAFALQSDGKIAVIGDVLNGGSGLARLTVNGTTDPAPAYSTDWPPYCVAVGPDNSIFVGGILRTIGGVTVDGIARIAPNGLVDPNFVPPVGFPGSPGGIVQAIAVQPDGAVLVGGDFTAVGSVSHSSLARFSATGAFDAGFAPSYPNDLAQPSVLAIAADGGIVVGTSLNTSGRINPQLAMMRYANTGALDARMRFSCRAPGGLGDAIALRNGKYLLVGGFDHVGGQLRTGLARLNADLSVDTSFQPDSTIYYVGHAAELGDGRLVAEITRYFAGSPYAQSGTSILSAGGQILATLPIRMYLTGIAGAPGGKILLWGFVNGDTTGGAVVLANPDGSIVWATSNFDWQVMSAAIQDDGKVVVGGLFTKFGGQPAKYIARLNADGTLDSQFTSPGDFWAGFGVAVTRDQKILVGTSSLLRLNRDGTHDAGWAAQQQHYVSSLLVEEDDSVLALETVETGDRHVKLLHYLADGRLDPDFVAFGLGGSTAGKFVMRDDGQIAGASITGNSNLFVSQSVAAPFLTVSAAERVPVGAATTLACDVTSALGVTYQWYLNDVAIAGATNANYAIPSFHAPDVGNYTVRATNELGAVTSPAATVQAPVENRGRLSNLSIRAAAGTGDRTLIVGFTVGGDDTGGDKPLVVRASGPTLAAFGVSGTLPDPILELYDHTGALVDENDDWKGVYDFTQLGAFPFAGPAPKDAAIYNPYVRNGLQTAHVLAKGSATGVVLAEVYDATAADVFTATTPRLINGSARTNVGSGDDVLILGFNITGQNSVRLLIRAAGPTLGAAPFNIGGVIADPKLEVYKVGGAKLGENDNWEDNGAHDAMVTAFQAVSAFGFGAGSKDSAVIMTLAPGGYSAVVRGVGGTTGIAIVELYELP